MDKPKITVVGSSNTDMVVKAERLPKPGETVLGGEFVMVQGGKGANQAVAAARLGANVTFVARIGPDVFGDEALRALQEEGIDTQFIVRDSESRSGTALIIVDSKGENSIVVASGANSRLTSEDVDAAHDTISRSQALVLQLETPLETVEHAAELARGMGVPVILDPAPARSGGLPGGLLARVDVLTPNETEAKAILGLPDDSEIDEKTAIDLLATGPRAVVITVGAKGCIVADPDGARRFPAVKVEAVDTTAAGDAFTGALTVGLASGRSLTESAELAGKAAAFSVTRMGAQSSLPTLEELASSGLE